MKTKKTTIITLILSLFFALYTPNLESKERSDIQHSLSPTDSVQNIVYLNRLSEIDALDKSNLSFKEKKELRTEVKKIKRVLKTNGNGVYLSAGALIIIILLLIVLL